MMANDCGGLPTQIVPLMIVAIQVRAC